MEYAPQAREALAFSQVNPIVATALREYVHAAVQRFTPQRVIDAYAGTGALSARLVADGISVVAIEADPAGAEAASGRLQLAGDSSATARRVVCDLVERALPALAPSEIPDVVVLNPPRRGVHGDVTSWLEADAQQAIRGVVYVSCDPATLARDLSRLPSWQVAAVQCFDMFPQTAHIETVCVLQREPR
jgi:tRNA/tmRNA/rRNA uracil-C5-methylase (TrmA/RlmC/RlmD family)